MTLTPHDDAKLAGVHPDLVRKVGQILAALAALGFPMTVTDGVRTVERQQALYAQGRTLAGPIVTNCDGVTSPSPHQPRADGWGHAVDCAFLVEGQPSWDARRPWKAYGAAAEALGLTWGGSWTRLHDLPHVEIA